MKKNILISTTKDLEKVNKITKKNNKKEEHWNIIIKRTNYFQNYENQQRFMDNLFYKLNLKSLDEFKDISKSLIISNGGNILLSRYKFDLKVLLRNIYRNFHWEFEKLTEKDLTTLSIASSVYIKNYKSKLQKNNSKNVNNNENLINLNNLKNLSTKIIQEINEKYFHSLENQICFFNHLFIKFNLKNLNSWGEIPLYKISHFIGGRAILFLYENNLPKLLINLYKNFDFNWENFEKILHSLNYFKKNILNQRKFMDNLFIILKLNSIDDWINVNKKIIIKNGGRNLLLCYKNDKIKLLNTIYPNILIYSNINKQRELMDQIFQKLKLKSLNDWLNISRWNFISNGGKILLKIYFDDFEKILKFIYPFHNFNFENINMKFNISKIYSNSIIKTRKKLNYIRKKYFIKEKKDWYRLKVETEYMNIFNMLKKVYPFEEWNVKEFYIRVKKSKQRILFHQIQNLFKSNYLIENYRHPKIISEIGINRIYEFDIFLPSLNLAFEYQGIQHYDDLPSAFNQLQVYQFRDQSKEKISFQNNIRLIAIPYWWNSSFSSLYSTILSQLKFE